MAECFGKRNDGTGPKNKTVTRGAGSASSWGKDPLRGSKYLQFERATPPPNYLCKARVWYIP